MSCRSSKASNRACGSICLVATIVLVACYTTWAILTPFLPPDAIVQSFFPDRSWAVRGPAIVLVIGLGGVGTFVGLTIRQELGPEKGRGEVGTHSTEPSRVTVAGRNRRGSLATTKAA